MRAVQPLHKARRRAIALVRVSKERDGMISPENQRYAIEQYADRENIAIVEWVEGIDESGSRKKSAWWAKLDAAVKRIEDKTAEVLLVWRIDRTARSRVRWAVATDRVETAGGYIESATEPNDRSPAGRFGRGVMAEHAAFMAESIGATWKETLERRVRHGMTPNGARHFGYTYTRGEGYRPHPEESPVLADMYRSYISGVSAWELADRYTDPTASPNESGQYERYARWNTAAVLRVLDSGFGAGFIGFRGELHEGAHEAVISAAEWELYQNARTARRRRPRAERSPYLYSGFIYCHCGSRMGGRMDHGQQRYGCTAAIQYPSRRHPNASLSARIVDSAVERWVFSMAAELDATSEKIPDLPQPVASPKRDLAAKLTRATERIDSATMRYVDGTIPKDAYDRVLAKLEAERQSLEEALTRASAQEIVQPAPFLHGLTQVWEEMTLEAKREGLRMFIDRIVVAPPGVEPRVTITHNADLT